MKLTVLVDNNTLIDRYFLGEPAVSFFLEDEGHEILFDVGYSDAFLQNARGLSIDLTDVEAVVLSHGHFDHTWGLAPLFRLHSEQTALGRPPRRPRIVAHPSTFSRKVAKGRDEIGSLLGEDRLSRYFDLQLDDRPVWLTPRLVYLGEIQRSHGHEGKRPIGKVLENGLEQDDFLRDDSALAFRSRDGLVVVTGCSHSGICNILDHARRVCGEERIADVIGGFHLQNPSEEQLTGTVKYFEARGPRCVHACHCTDLGSKIALARVADVREVGVGLTLEYAP